MTAPPATDLLTLDPAARDLLFRAARTANTFTAEPVTDEQIRAVHDLVRHAPTAYNGQPLRILLLRSAAARARLLPHLSASNRPKTATAPLTAVLAADTEFHTHLPRLYPHRPEVPGRLAADPAGREAQARVNTAIQIGYLIVGIRAAGLAAGPMAGFDPTGVDAEFFPDGRLRAVLILNIGRPGPNAWSDRLPRLDHDDVIQTL